MAEAGANEFDPYYEWFGIPTDHQPPHDYRLVGVSPFERDPDVIATAAQIRLSFLGRQMQSPRGEQAKRLKSEVNLALERLLDPQERSAYERLLSEQWGVNPETTLPFDHRPGAEPVRSVDATAHPPTVAGKPLPPHLRGATSNGGSSSAGASPPPPQPPTPRPQPPHLAAQTPTGTPRAGVAPAVHAPAMAAPNGQPAPSGLADAGNNDSISVGTEESELNGPSGVAVRQANRASGSRKVSTRNRWIAGILVALAFLPIHAVLAVIGYHLANSSPSSTGENTVGPTLDTSSPEARAPKSPPSGGGIEFSPSASLEWPEVDRWWRDPRQGTVELWVTAPRASGFMPIVGVYGPPPESLEPSPANSQDGSSPSEDDAGDVAASANPPTISAGRGWRGWVLGLERDAQESHYSLVLRRRDEREEVSDRWPTEWSIDDRTPHHLAVVIDGPAATMWLDGKSVGQLGASKLRQTGPATASMWVGAGQPLQEPGSWRGLLLGMRVSSEVRPLATLGPRADWPIDSSTVLQWARGVHSAAEPRVVRDASRQQRVGHLVGAVWVDYSE
ncbi:MAG: hypothetical protein R3B96_23645 [Pirellulaceae bacterium]